MCDEVINSVRQDSFLFCIVFLILGNAMFLYDPEWIYEGNEREKLSFLNKLASEQFRSTD